MQAKVKMIEIFMIFFGCCLVKFKQLNDENGTWTADFYKVVQSCGTKQFCGSRITSPRIEQAAWLTRHNLYFDALGNATTFVKIGTDLMRHLFPYSQ